MRKTKNKWSGRWRESPVMMGVMEIGARGYAGSKVFVNNKNSGEMAKEIRIEKCQLDLDIMPFVTSKRAVSKK